METSAIDPVVALAQTDAATAGATKELGRDEFLKLLVAKLSNQDPLNPAQDTEFVAQLATFSSLEQLISANKNLESLALGQSNLVNAQALDLIGKEALIESDYTWRVKDGVPDDLVYALPRTAQQATLSINDANGTSRKIFELELDPQGRVTLDWDGVLDDGTHIEDGEYTITVNVVDLDGEPMPIALFRSIPIEGVAFDNGSIDLISGDRVVPYDMIMEIRSGRGQAG